MKILHITPSYKPAYIYGGTIESIARLCEGLANAGEEITVFTTTANGKEELTVEPGKEYNVEGVAVFYFKRITKDHSHISPLLWKQVYQQSKNFDVIHIHSWWNPLIMVAAYICKKQNRNTFFSPRGMLSNYIIENSNSFSKKIAQKLFGKVTLQSSVLHATSQQEYDECLQLLPGWNGFILPNLLWLPEIKIEKRNNNVFTILFLSRVHPKKGIEILMDALASIRFNFCLQIGGTGEEDYIQSLKKKALSLGITKKIEWLGWQNRDKKFKTLMNCDLFALTSYNENFANAVVEALHVGTPVCITTNVGLSSFVKEHDLGWICDAAAEDIKAKLENAFTDEVKQKSIHERARAVINACFSEKILIPQYIYQYKKHLKR